MRTIENKIIKQRKHLYKLLESFTEKDLNVVMNFIEFLQYSKLNGDNVFLNQLLNFRFRYRRIKRKNYTGNKES